MFMIIFLSISESVEEDQFDLEKACIGQVVGNERVPLDGQTY
jgi:hypothetical protein